MTRDKEPIEQSKELSEVQKDAINAEKPTPRQRREGLKPDELDSSNDK